MEGLYVGQSYGATPELLSMSTLSPIRLSPSLPDHPLGQIYGYVAVQVDRGILHCGGKTSETSPAKKECYLLSNTAVWNKHVSMGTPRFRPSAVLFWSGVLVTGGEDASGKVLASTEILKNGTWIESVPLPTPLTRHCMLSLNRTHHIITGGSQSTKTKQFSSATYIFSNNKFAQVANMTTARRSHGCALAGQNIFVGGGFNEELLSSVEYFSLTSLSWHPAPSLPLETTYGVLTNLGGNLYFIGGRNNKNIYRLNTSSRKAVMEMTWELAGTMEDVKHSFSALVWDYSGSACA